MPHDDLPPEDGPRAEISLAAIVAWALSQYGHVDTAVKKLGRGITVPFVIVALALIVGAVWLARDLAPAASFLAVWVFGVGVAAALVVIGCLVHLLRKNPELGGGEVILYQAMMRGTRDVPNSPKIESPINNPDLPAPPAIVGELSSPIEGAGDA